MFVCVHVHVCVCVCVCVCVYVRACNCVSAHNPVNKSKPVCVCVFQHVRPKQTSILGCRCFSSYFSKTQYSANQCLWMWACFISYFSKVRNKPVCVFVGVCVCMHFSSCFSKTQSKLECMCVCFSSYSGADHWHCVFTNVRLEQTLSAGQGEATPSMQHRQYTSQCV